MCWNAILRSRTVLREQQKKPYRSVQAPLEAKSIGKAHGYCGKAFGIDLYQPPFAQSLSKGFATKPLISFKAAVHRQAQHERFGGQ
jgi:hypothetical protein